MMKAADSRSGAFVEYRIMAWTMAENKGHSAPQTSHDFSSQIRTHADISQSCLANSVGPLGSALNVTSSGNPSLTTHLQSGLAAFALCSTAPSRFLYTLSFNCLSHCPE